MAREARGEGGLEGSCPCFGGEGGFHLWERTKEEALKNLEEVLQMVLEEMRRAGEPVPAEALVSESEEPLVTVTLT